MTSTRPYLIRAFYDWIVDNNCTPHIVVNASYEHVQVPIEYIDNGQIVLNVSISAVQGLILGDQAIEFQARFGGKICKVYAPVGSILAIYAKENGRGMVFAEDENPEDMEETYPETTPSIQPQTPSLSLAITTPASPDSGTDNNGSQDDGGSSGKGGKGKRKGGPSHLTLVK